MTSTVRCLSTITILGYFAIATSRSVTTSQLVNNNAKITAVYLGTIEGKSFFNDLRTMNWTEAKKACADSNLQLANIDTKAQHDFLLGLNSSASFPVGQSYWTAGRDAQTFLQFVWDGTGETINGDIAELSVRAEIATCLTWGRGYGRFYADSCSSYRYVLCELVHGKTAAYR